MYAWLDLYAILNLPERAEANAIRRRIAECEAYARKNQNRLGAAPPDYQWLDAAQTLAQCRRILLDNDLRATYDRLLQLHRAGHGNVTTYVNFVAGIHAADLKAAAKEPTPAPVVSAPRLVRHGQRVLSSMSVYLMTGVVVVLLSNAIFMT